MDFDTPSVDVPARLLMPEVVESPALLLPACLMALFAVMLAFGAACFRTGAGR